MSAKTYTETYEDARSEPVAAGLLADERGESMIENGINLIIAVLVGGLLASILLPIAIDNLENVSTSNWSSDTRQLWGLLPFFLVLAVFFLFIAWGISVYRSET